MTDFEIWSLIVAWIAFALSVYQAYRTFRSERFSLELHHPEVRAFSKEGGMVLYIDFIISNMSTRTDSVTNIYLDCPLGRFCAVPDSILLMGSTSSQKLNDFFAQTNELPLLLSAESSSRHRVAFRIPCPCNSPFYRDIAPEDLGESIRACSSNQIPFVSEPRSRYRITLTFASPRGNYIYSEPIPVYSIIDTIRHHKARHLIDHYDSKSE